VEQRLLGPEHRRPAATIKAGAITAAAVSAMA
jgi:hypothetical protein